MALPGNMLAGPGLGEEGVEAVIAHTHRLRKTLSFYPLGPNFNGAPREP